MQHAFVRFFSLVLIYYPSTSLCLENAFAFAKIWCKWIGWICCNSWFVTKDIWKVTNSQIGKKVFQDIHHANLSTEDFPSDNVLHNDICTHKSYLETRDQELGVKSINKLTIELTFLLFILVMLSQLPKGTGSGPCSVNPSPKLNVQPFQLQVVSKGLQGIPFISAASFVQQPVLQGSWVGGGWLNFDPKLGNYTDAALKTLKRNFK